MVSNCNSFYKGVAGDACFKIAQKYNIDTGLFIQWNPAVGQDCSLLLVGDYYCVDIAGPTTTVGPTGAPTPSPTQDGLISSCKAFYKAQSGDSCSKIVDSYGTFTLDDFLKWNPAVGQDCTSLLAGYYYCVGIPGTPTSKPPGGSEPTGAPPSG